MNILIRHELLKYDSIRHATFAYSATLDPSRFVQHGFYFAGDSTKDTVCCFSCNITLSKWNSQLDPMARHHNTSPGCPFLEGRDPNVPLHTDCGTPFNSGPPISNTSMYTFQKPPYIEGRALSGMSNKSFTLQHTVDVIVPEPEVPSASLDVDEFMKMMASPIERLKSFERTTSSATHQLFVLKMVNNGFFALPLGNVAQCYMCRVIIKGWNRIDVPNDRHRKASPNCPLVKCDAEYLQGASDDSSLCKVCLMMKVAYAFDCGHCVCDRCLPKVSKCHFCREVVDRVKVRKLYLN